MDNFNFFSDMLEDVEIIFNNRYYLLGKQGDEKVMIKEKYVSDNMVNARVLIYDIKMNSLEWKCLYKSSKGLFFVKKKRIYIQDK